MTVGRFSAGGVLHAYWWAVGAIIVGVVIGAVIGGVFALKIAMTDMPQMVALFNGFGGGASVLVAGAELLENTPVAGGATVVATMASGLIGAVTFWGSLIAFGKLSGKLTGNPILLPGRNVLNVLLALATAPAPVIYPQEVHDGKQTLAAALRLQRPHNHSLSANSSL